VFLQELNDIRGRNPQLINELMLAAPRRSDVEVLREVFIDPAAEQPTPLAGIYRLP
jgi:hypothetical protein